MGLWPRRAGGQLALLLVAVLLVAQLITVWILAGERQGALRMAGLEHVLQRVSDAYTLLATTDDQHRDRATRLLSSRNLLLTIDPQPYLAEDRAPRFSRQLADELGLEQARVRSALEVDEERCAAMGRRDHDDDDDHHERDDHDRHGEHAEDRHNCPPTLSLSVALADGQWLNAGARAPRPSWLWLRATLTSVGITAALLILTVLVAIRYILRPVNELSNAAHAFGRGEKVAIQERGPEDIREVTRAFNQMQHQVTRAQADRERLLAALAHDLRTPITSMRLRVELLPEGEDRDRLLDTLEDMQQLAEATLDFIRGSATEQHRRFDLSALLDSLCDDLRELGMPVICHDSPRCVLQGQSEAVKRALRNLIENAVKYGEQADVHLEIGERDATVVITDRGPGIPATEQEKVFEPFYRLEQSRNRETGGAGLGLAIARTLVRGLGGEIHLGSGPDGQGLSVRVTLPTTGQIA
ncbi:HAMP domain-containing sensor histidine kinase [Marinobacteraceae bacterium S3BR75-40.1]